MTQPPKLSIIYLPATDLVKLKGNPRIDVDPKAIERLAKLIKQHGFQNPLQVYKLKGKHEILAGNHRFDAGLSLGIKEFPCIVYEGNRKQALARAISDNQSATWTDFDLPLLKEILIDLDDGSLDMSITGFNSHELELMMTAIKMDEPADAEAQIDKAEELNKTWQVKAGDLWQIGEHRLLCRDSTKREDVQRVMNGEKADMVFTDPPYGMFLDAEGFDKMPTAKGTTHKSYSNVIGDADDFNPNFIKTIFDNFGYCKEVFIWGADYFAELIPNRNSGSFVVWDKRQEGGTDKLFGSSFELCWSKARHKREIARVLWAGYFGMSGEDTKSRVHPTQKPTALAVWFFNHWGTVGDLVADIYLGSGSTMVAAENLKRRCFGIEISESYCAVILQRMQDAFPSIEIKKIEKE